MSEPGKSKEEEFYYLLTEGSEHLQAGRIDEARQHFERALVLNPTNEQGLNLLGLSLFRLGQLERAKQIFTDLVYANPIEPSLRLNLAMVFLKQGKLEDAHTELERVLELNPDHPRAASYMGLVLEKKGQLDRAADFYERAGNKKRADEIRAFRPTKTGTFPIPNLAAMGVQQEAVSAAPGPAAMRASSASAPATPATSTPPTPASTASAAPTVSPTSAGPGSSASMGDPPGTQPLGSGQNQKEPAGGQSTSGPTSTMPAPTSRAPAPAPTPMPQPAPAATNKPPPPPAVVAASATSAASARATETAALTAATAAITNKGPELPRKSADDTRSQSNRFGLDPALSTPPTTPDAGPRVVVETALERIDDLGVRDDALSITAEGQMVMPIVEVGYVRTDLLTSLSGAFELEVVNRRYRGKRTDSLFGGVEASVVAVMGQGFCVLDLGELLPTALTLASEEIYLVESAVVGFSSGLVWENGRLPSESDRDLDIVHLRGSGRVVLGSKQRVVSLPVEKEAPVVVHAHKLLGWTGQLVPYRAPLPGLPETARRIPVVRFEGTGTVLTRA